MKPAQAMGVLAMTLILSADDAGAVIGRPAMPLSYTGVARQTTRRMAYSTAAASAVATSSTLTALPADCVETVASGVTYQRCGATYYRPYYQGPNVVYLVARP